MLMDICEGGGGGGVRWVAPYYGSSLRPWKKQPEFSVYCTGTRKLSNIILCNSQRCNTNSQRFNNST